MHPLWIEQADLSHLNSFSFPSTAERYIEVNDLDTLISALDDVKQNNWPLLILGGGSNLVLERVIPGAVLHISASGVSILADDDTTAVVEAAAGENWHKFVGAMLEKGLHGLENLALIPGTVGAAPVQNIGAYGAELSDVLHSVIAFDRQKGELVQLSAPECKFGYRDSLFKRGEPGRYIIWQVRFILSSEFTPNLSYKALANQFAGDNAEKLTALSLYQAVCEIRKEKLPVPSEVGNAGSFFENPVVSAEHFKRIKEQHPDLVAYPLEGGRYKLAAGWLIDQAGFKGHRSGSVGVYHKQALVLVNHGGGDAIQLLKLASQIRSRIKELFDVALTIEPRIYP